MFLATADRRKTANCRAVERSEQMNSEDSSWYQLIGRATYLRCATVALTRVAIAK